MRLWEPRGRNNAETLFGLEQIPSAPQIRNGLDEIEAKSLFGVFDWAYQALQKIGWLKCNPREATY